MTGDPLTSAPASGHPDDAFGGALDAVAGVTAPMGDAAGATTVGSTGAGTDPVNGTAPAGDALTADDAPSGTLDPLALANQLCFSLTVASRSVVHSYRPVLEPLGLTHPQYLVMLALWGSSPRTVKDLGQELLQDSATLSPLLKRLEAHGLLVRQRDPDNERALAVTLTEQGRALRERALAVPPEMMKRLGVTLEQLQELNRSMKHLTDNARASDDE